MTTVGDIVASESLTPGQLGLLYDSLSEPGEHVFVERLVCPLYGELELATFAGVWQRLVARHDALRTGFVCDSPQGPKQAVHRTAELEIRLLDWSDLDSRKRAVRLDETLRAETEREFVLERPPLMRLALARVDREEVWLIWTSQHLILDGWSCWVLLCEAAWLYLADQNGIALALPAAPSFIDYAQWLAREDRVGTHAAYWRAYLDGYRAVSSHPATREQRKFQQLRKSLSRDISEVISEWQRRARRTINTLAQAAWALVLAQEHGADEVVFGTVFSGRTSAFPGAADLVGLMINVLPVRVAMAWDVRLEDWMDRLQERHAEMLEHETCSLHEVRRWAGVERENRLFDSVLVIMNIDPKDHLPPLGFRMGKPTYFANASYPLGVNVTPGEQIQIEMLHDLRYFSPARVERLYAAFATALLAVASSDASTRLGDLRRSLSSSRPRLSAAGRRTSIPAAL
ncbi:MAG TPA: condensation domain-containing protein [Candidatus Dormibacteraeota bacterium]|nr:condensation domain-containing protein [Candidatus Dormibacteraeota bacterium]